MNEFNTDNRFCLIAGPKAATKIDSFDDGNPNDGAFQRHPKSEKVEGYTQDIYCAYFDHPDFGRFQENLLRPGDFFDRWRKSADRENDPKAADMLDLLDNVENPEKLVIRLPANPLSTLPWLQWIFKNDVTGDEETYPGTETHKIRMEFDRYNLPPYLTGQLELYHGDMESKFADNATIGPKYLYRTGYFNLYDLYEQQLEREAPGVVDAEPPPEESAPPPAPATRVEFPPFNVVSTTVRFEAGDKKLVLEFTGDAEQIEKILYARGLRGRRDYSVDAEKHTLTINHGLTTKIGKEYPFNIKLKDGRKVAVAGVATTREIDRAEYQLLSEDMLQRSQRNAWAGVGVDYNRMRSLIGVTIKGDYHYLGALVARREGDVDAYYERMKLALEDDELDQETKESAEREVNAIETSFGRMEIILPPGSAYILKPRQMPFEPDKVEGIKFANKQLAKHHRFSGLIPAGEYTLELIGAEPSGGAPKIFEVVSMRVQGEAPSLKIEMTAANTTQVPAASRGSGTSSDID